MVASKMCSCADKSLPGGETRAIDLNGQNRIIEKVVLRYNTRRDRGQRAIVQLFGQR